MAENETRQVTKGKVRVKKKTLKERVFKNLVEEDARSIGDYIIDELIIPACMNTVHNIITGTADKIFGGSSRRNVSSNQVVVNRPIGGNFEYNRVGTQQGARSRSDKYDFKQFLFVDRKDADDVKDQLVAVIEGPYQKASIADFYEFIGPAAEKYSEFTDHKYGWTMQDIKLIQVKYAGNGYIVDLPKPHPF